MKKHPARNLFLLLASSILGTIVSASVFAAESTSKVEQKNFPLSAVEVLEIRNTAGDVLVERASGTSATVIVTKKDFSKHCKIDISVKKSLLKIVVSKTTGRFFDSCNAEISVTVGENTALDLRTGAGDISAKELKGGITFRTGSGDVELKGAFPKIEGKTGSGDIVAYNLAAEDVDMATGSGDIKVTFDKVPSLGRVELKTGSGDTIVWVPKGSKVKSSLLNGMGDVVNEIGDSPGAKFDISVRSGSGDLKLKQSM